MYKANKQIGFIYKDNESIDRILKDSEVVFERGFLREKTSTTLPITFGGVGKDLKDYKVYGNTVQSKLPSGYTQVDYIESNGTQYIDTGYYGNLNTEVQLKVTNSNSNLDRQLFGDITTSSQAISCNLSLSTRLTSRFGNKSVSLTFGDYVSENEIFTLIENKDGIYINNSQIATFDATDNFSTPNSLLLLTRNSASGAGTIWNGKLYYTKIYDNNMLVRDFIPCYRNSDNEVGLYDLVNNVFYTNRGTGVFTYGSIAPTPDAPIEIVSCGDRTKNLCFTNFDNWESGQYYTNGEKTDMYARIRLKELFKVETGKQYYFNTFSEFKFILRAYDENKDFISSFGAIENGSTLTLQPAKYLGITIYNPNDSSLVYSDYETLFENGTIRPLICLNSETDKSYEPYGYKIPLNIKSENLLNNTLQSGTKNGITLIRNSDGSITANGTATANTYFDIGKFVQKQGIAYTLNGCPKGGGDSKYRLYILGETNLYFDNGNGINFPIINTDTVRTVRLAIYNGMTVKNLTFYPMIKLTEKGNIKYQPYYNETTNIYLKEPLRKIDGYSDYIDFKNSKVVRNIKEHVFNGTDNDNYVFTSDNTKTLGINILPNKIDSPALKLIGVTSNICDKFIYYNNISDIEHIYSSNGTQIDETKRISNIRLYVNKSRLNGYSPSMTNNQKIELLKTWLSSNNVTVNYILVTPTEESITLPNIPTIDGENTMTIETEITPSEVYIKYKSNI